MALLLQTLVSAQETSAPTSVPTSAPTSVPTSAPAPVPTAAPVPSAAPVPMTKIEFDLTLNTSASCSDMTAGSSFAAAMKEVGGQLAGGVSLDAVSVACSAAARRLREARRLQQQALTMGYDVEVPTAQAAAAEAALASVTLADVQAIISTAVTNSGTSLTFTVDEASITALK